MDIRGLGNPLVIIDGIPRDNMARVDPEDVESISVFEGCLCFYLWCACCQWRDSYYHQKGAQRKPEINYSGSFTWQMPSISQIWLLHKNG